MKSNKLKDPGIILTVALIIYALLVFVWWPVILIG